MDADIEAAVKLCEPCQQSRPLPAAAPLHPWQWPTRPWSRLHIDYAGPLDGKMFLVVIDAHSKWIEVFPVTSATAQSTIQKLRQLFSQFGVPESIVSDNGTQFTAQELEISVHLTEFNISAFRRIIPHLMAWQKGPYKCSNKE